MTPSPHLSHAAVGPMLHRIIRLPLKVPSLARPPRKMGIAAARIPPVFIGLFSIWLSAPALASPGDATPVITAIYEVSPIATQRADYPQITTLRAGTVTYLRSLYLKPREFHLQGLKVQIRGRIRPPNHVESQVWDGLVVDVKEIMTPQAAGGVSLAGVREPPRVRELAGLRRCARAWCSVTGVLDWVRGDGPEPPYALLRLQDDSEVEVLKVITARGHASVWHELIGEEVTVVLRMKAGGQQGRRFFAARADAICAGVADRCGMFPGTPQGRPADRLKATSPRKPVRPRPR